MAGSGKGQGWHGDSYGHRLAAQKAHRGKGFGRTVPGLSVAIRRAKKMYIQRGVSSKRGWRIYQAMEKMKAQRRDIIASQSRTFAAYESFKRTGR